MTIRLDFRFWYALSARERALLAAGIFAACYFLFDFFIYTPITKELEATKRRIDELNAKIQEYYDEYALFGLLSREVSQLRTKSNVYRDRLSRLGQPEEILETLANLCRRFGIEISSLKPQEQNLNTPAYRGYNVTMELRCTFQKAVQLLAALQDLPFYLIIQKLVIRHEENDMVSVSLSLKTFMAVGSPS